MTIFQKMLFLPVLSIVLYGSFLFYSYSEHQKYSSEITSFGRDYIPLMGIANQNNLLFDQISDTFKDAALTSELNWLKNTIELNNAINVNFDKLRQINHQPTAEQVERSHQNFRNYYKLADQLARKVIADKDVLVDESQLISNVNQYHNQSKQDFLQLTQTIQRHFQLAVETTNTNFNRVLIIGGAISAISVMLLLTVTIYVSVSTRRSVYQVILRMKSLALGETKFSNRLKHSQRDELGYLIHWFNKLSDKLEENYLEIEKASITDKLTQLNNRNRADSYFPHALKLAQENNGEFAAVILDIDKFKSVNDTYGHLKGDEVIQKVANILKQNIDSHSFLARWGGEEFIILLSNLTTDEATSKTDALREVIANSSFEGISKVTASFGIAFAQPNDNVNSLMARADECLYQAKASGRNRVVTEFQLT